MRWDADNRLYAVTFESGMFYASVEECNEGFFGGFPLHAITEDGKCKIVGNIYDNQELLKKLFNTMTEKEKAKAYDEALKKASAAHKDEDRHLKATLERIFPELKESEDEKMKTAILNHLKKMWGNCQDDVCGVHVEDAIAWLEKQGEQEELQVYETKDGKIITYSETDGYKFVEPRFNVGDKIIDIHRKYMGASGT